ncbi:hypothetical protein [Bauldia sp.]|uniref:hypothetical protein n=1 Tax=Bauldia sp. TaxID=2575872 RepID=UPI003BAB8B38
MIVRELVVRRANPGTAARAALVGGVQRWARSPPGGALAFSLSPDWAQAGVPAKATAIAAEMIENRFT